MTIGVDTNVLVRLFVDDGTEQGVAARRLVADRAEEGIVLSSLVVAEFVRVMRRHYRQSLSAVVERLDRLLEAPEFLVQDRAIIDAALAIYRQGGTEFSDCLIVAAARAAGAQDVFTFDREAARRIPGAVLLQAPGN